MEPKSDFTVYCSEVTSSRGKRKTASPQQCAMELWRPLLSTQHQCNKFRKPLIKIIILFIIMTSCTVSLTLTLCGSVMMGGGVILYQRSHDSNPKCEPSDFYLKSGKLDCSFKSGLVMSDSSSQLQASHLCQLMSSRNLTSVKLDADAHETPEVAHVRLHSKLLYHVL